MVVYCKGPNGLAGRWGHNPLPISFAYELPAPACYCGKHGCIEVWLSGPALVADYQKRTPDKSITDVPALVNAATHGNHNAQLALDRHTQRLARALAVIINACDPTAIVLGGGVSQRPGLINDLNTTLPPAHVFLPAGTPLQTKISYCRPLVIARVCAVQHACLTFRQDRPQRPSITPPRA